jgi:anti-sigma B factor antagonist
VAQQKIDIEVSNADGFQVLSPTGDLDVYTVGSLRDAIANILESSGGGDSAKVVVDLDGVPFMDSSGLGALMGGVRRLREAGGDLAISCTREQHLKLFTITGFAEGVSIAPTVEEAAQGFRN